MIYSCKGQSLVEFPLVLMILVAIVTGVGKLMFYQLRQIQCSHLVFESVLARLTKRTFSAGSSYVSLVESPVGVSGTGVCGEAKAVVKLPKLEAAVY